MSIEKELGLIGPIVVAEQDVIETYEASLRQFFTDIFGMNYDEVLVTDESQLSDFVFAGEEFPEPDMQGKALPDLYNEWDAWVLPRVCTRYNLEPGSFKTSIRLIALMAKIQEQASSQLH